MLTPEQMHISDAQEACERAADLVVEAAKAAVSDPSDAAGQFLEARKGQFLQRCERLCFLLLESSVDLRKYRALHPQLKDLPIRWSRNFADPEMYPSIREVIRRWDESTTSGSIASSTTADNLTSHPLRWLHLSDLHIGSRGEPAWWHVLDKFWRSIDEYLTIVGAPDLVLLTGDLTFKGEQVEFDKLTRFLENLLVRLPKTTGGLAPLIVTLPGNHDLQRPSGSDARRYRLLRDYDKGRDDEDVAGLLAELWDKKDASFVQPLFEQYLAWFDAFIRPQAQRAGVNMHTSFFPGDVFLSLRLPGRFPLAVVALNSAWLQYQGGDFEGKLALPVEQFHAALPHGKNESPLDALKGMHRALLLMHHPRGWLSAAQRHLFDSEIYPGERFVACLHGHMHEPDSVNNTRAGGVARCYYQAPSLFGLEHYGSKNESRSIGYTWASLRDDGELRAWPLKFLRKGDGTEVFDRDEIFHWDRATGNVLLRPADGVRYKCDVLVS